MSTIIGRQINIGIGKETTRGTAVAPSHYIKQSNADIDDKFEGVLSEVTVGVLEESDQFDVVKKWSEGSIEGRIYDASFGLVMLSALGAVSSVESADSGVYDHTFSVAQSTTHQSLTIDVKADGNEQKKFANCVIDGLEITADPANTVNFNASFMGKSGVASSETVAYASENGFIGKNVTVKFATNKAGLAGASAVNVNDLSLSITKNVASDDVLGSVEPDDFYNGRFVIEGSVELIFDDTTYKDLALAGTAQAMRIQIINSDVTIGASSNPEILIDLAKVNFTEYSRSGALDDIVRQTLTFKALYSVSDSEMVECVITNTETSY